MGGNTMKRRFGVVLTVAMLVLTFVLSGCAGDKDSLHKFGKTDKSLYLYADMAIQDVIVADFDTKKLDLEEYKGFLEKEVAIYNGAHKFVPGNAEKRLKTEPEYTAPLTIVKCEVSSNMLYQQILYANVNDYNQYNEGNFEELGGTFVKTGTLAAADPEVLNTAYVTTDGAKVDVKALCNRKDAADYRYIITDFPCALYGDGKIVAIANGMKYEKEISCVGSGSANLSIVIYK